MSRIHNTIHFISDKLFYYIHNLSTANLFRKSHFKFHQIWQNNCSTFKYRVVSLQRIRIISSCSTNLTNHGNVSVGIHIAINIGFAYLLTVVYASKLWIMPYFHFSFALSLVLQYYKLTKLRWTIDFSLMCLAIN